MIEGCDTMSLNTKQGLAGGIVSNQSLSGSVARASSASGTAVSGGNITGSAKRNNIIYIDTYQLAVRRGYKGTIDEWLESLYPVKGKDYFTAEEVQEIIDIVLNETMQNLPKSRIGEITIFANKWVGAESPYSQVVEVAGATEYSQVDLTPSVAQLAIFHEKDLAFVTENDGGVVTVYAIGQKPLLDYTIQVTITEVDV